MIKKTITFTDYNGVERTEDYYFNLSRAEVAEMEMSTSGGLTERIKRITDGLDGPEIFKIFKEFIAKSYGIKSPDGKRFIKSEEISNEFFQTEAYSVLLMELMTSEKAAADFMNSIIPSVDNK